MRRGMHRFPYPILHILYSLSFPLPSSPLLSLPPPSSFLHLFHRLPPLQPLPSLPPLHPLLLPLPTLLPLPPAPPTLCPPASITSHLCHFAVNHLSPCICLP